MSQIRMLVCTFAGSILMPSNLRQAFGEKLCVGMILGQLLRPLFQRDQTCRRKNARLAHAAAESLAINAAAIDQLCIADEQRSHRRAQPLRQAKHHRVGFGCQLCNRNSERDGGIEHARSVQMHWQSGGVYVVRKLRQILPAGVMVPPAIL